MFVQIAIGSVIIVLSVLVGGVGVLAMEIGFAKWHRWLVTKPHRPKMLVVMVSVSLLVLAVITTGVWIWALTFYGLGLFQTFEESMYFALITYTTLGFGDVLLAQDWRLLGGMAAANGLLNFGLLTALLVEALRHVRLGQMGTPEKHRD